MFFVVPSNDSFNFTLGLIKYVVIVCICTLCLCCTLCRSVSVLSCVNVIQSFTYVLRVVILHVTKRCSGRARVKARGNTNSLSQIPSRNEMK